MGELFDLLHHKAGITQTRIGTATGLTQGRVSAIIRRKQRGLDPGGLHQDRHGLNMPDQARILAAR